MRKKLLALLMCATMVLGSSAVASAATVTTDDRKNAATVIASYDKFAKEYDNSLSKVTFDTTYTISKGSTIIYSYDFDSLTDYVKLNSDSEKLYQVSTTEGEYNTYDTIDKIDSDGEYVLLPGGSNVLGDVVILGNSTWTTVNTNNGSVTGDCL